jgi:vitamin B12 transport system substrate-binding protein
MLGSKGSLVALIVLLWPGLSVWAGQRIISLAPHTTELIYALGAGENVLAVSDYSNFPVEASQLPSVASHNGLDFEKIMRLQPDLIVAWQGGNKPQDLARLVSLGFNVYYSHTQHPEDISDEVRRLGQVLGQPKEAEKLAQAFAHELADIKSTYYSDEKIPVFYYMWSNPLMTIGGKAWANDLLNICGAKNIFSDASTPYPEVSIEQVIRRQPQKIIAAMNTSLADASTFWEGKRDLLAAPLIIVNPDKLHRFTPRLIGGLRQLCQQIHQ